ncbi:hypothetical protein VPH35_135848 [Triticum aestivum]
MTGTSSALTTSTIGALINSTAGALTSAAAGSIASAPTISMPSLAGLITVRLTRANFHLWKAQVVPNLSGAGLFGYLDGSFPRPPQTVIEGTGDAAHQVPNPAYTVWWMADQAVLGALLSSMTEEVLGQMTRVTSSAAAWTALCAMFAAQNRAAVHQLRTQLNQTKKTDMSVSEYFHKMTGYADAMAAVGDPLTDEQIIGHIQGGLGQEYDPLVASLTIFDGAISLTNFYAHLLSFEARQEQHAAAGGDFSSSVNNVVRHGGGSSSRNGNRNGGGAYGSRNGGQNHGSQQHGGQNGQHHGGRGDNGNRNGGGGGNRRPKCQICRIFGHSALQCRQRYNHAYQADEYHGGNMVTHGHVDNHWLLDTGATDHLTNDLDRLTTHERYSGKDQVHVANGAGQTHEEGASSR